MNVIECHIVMGYCDSVAKNEDGAIVSSSLSKVSTQGAGQSAGALHYVEDVMQDWAASFYKSKAWQRTRAAYAKSVGGLCERCLKAGRYNAGVIVHHKVHLTPELITRPEIALSFDNLELLCKTCHDEERERTPKRWRIAPDGSVRVPPGP